MALVGVDAIDPFIGLLGRFGVLTAALAEIEISQANAAIGVSSDSTDHVLATDLAGGQAIVIDAMDVLGTHSLVIHLHDVPVVSAWIALFILV